jgi:putative transposase
MKDFPLIKIAMRLRDLLRQGCESKRIIIIKGGIGRDHVHLLMATPSHLSPDRIAQYLKGGSSRLLQESFIDLRKKYWDNLYGPRDIFAHRLGV